MISPRKKVTGARPATAVLWLILTMLFPAAEALGQGLTAPLHKIALAWNLDGEKEDFANLDHTRATISPKGKPVIWDSQARQLRLYLAPGVAPLRVGRGGEGPGEFGSAAVLVGWVADTLWSYDLSLQKFMFFSPTGIRLRETRLPKIGQPDSLALGAKGNVHGFQPRAYYADQSILGLGTTSQTLPNSQALITNYYYIVSADGTLKKGVASVPRPMRIIIPIPSPGPGISAGTQVGTGLFPLDPVESVEAISPNGNFVLTKHTEAREGAMADIRLTLTQADGVVAFSRSIPFAGTAIPRADLESAAATIPVAELRRLSLAKAPKIYAPVERIAVSSVGDSWLQLKSVGSITPMILLDQHGMPKLKVEIPGAKVELFAGTQSMVWVIVTNDDGFPSILGYQIQP